MAKENNLLFYLALALLILSVLAFSLNVTKLIRITGYAASTGSINLTVESRTQINFTTSMINWSSGAVTSGSPSATLDTSAGTVTNGNWTAVSSGLVLENIGNVNATLDLGAIKNASSLIGGTTPTYKWNMSNVEAGSCINSSGMNLGVFYEVNGTIRICGNFLNNNSKDTMRIDFQLVIPSDSLTGALNDTITATATAA